MNETEQIYWLLRIAKQAKLVSDFYENYDADVEDYDTALANLKLAFEQTPNEILAQLPYAANVSTDK